jgi:LuxR family maltose regulon positive regulatory protein
VQREWNDLEQAAHSLEEGIAGCRQTGNGVILLLGTIALARLRQAQGDAQGARDLVATLGQGLHTQHFLPHNAAQLAAWHARLSLLTGDQATAWRWAQERGLRVDDAPRAPLEIEHLTWARVLLSQHRPAEAATVLGRLLRLMESLGWTGKALEVLVLLALAQLARGDLAGALEQLARALSLAEPEGYIRLFVDEGEPMAQLLGHLHARHPGPRQGSAAYRTRLLGLLGRLPEASTQPAAGTSLPALSEPLSDRELEILRLIATGCSNREIAERLVLAVSTVKWYVNVLYGKLQVESRTKAIARARDLHLV